MKLKIFEDIIEREDRDKLAELFKTLKTLRAGIKTKKDATAAKAKIQELKSEINTYCFCFFGAILERGKDRIVMQYQETPIHAKDFIPKIKELNKKVREQRAAYKLVKKTDKSFLYYKYSTTGGVFMKPKSILALVNSVTEEEKLQRAKSPPATSKTNYVGVEMEMMVKCSREYLIDLFCDAGLGRYANIKSDGSIQVTSTHNNPIEITMMAPESEIKSVVSKVCTLLRKSRVDAQVNDSCGLHVHIDMRNRTPALCYNNLYYTQSILLGMVPANRRSEEDSHAARYCAKNESPDIIKQQEVNQRYRVINPMALRQHKTIEVRVHSGSTNAIKINNWIDIILGIVNYKEELKSHIKTIDKLESKIGLSSALISYIEKRTLKFKDKKINTQVDDLEEAI